MSIISTLKLGTNFGLLITLFALPNFETAFAESTNVSNVSDYGLLTTVCLFGTYILLSIIFTSKIFRVYKHSS